LPEEKGSLINVKAATDMSHACQILTFDILPGPPTLRRLPGSFGWMSNIQPSNHPTTSSLSAGLFVFLIYYMVYIPAGLAGGHSMR